MLPAKLAIYIMNKCSERDKVTCLITDITLQTLMQFEAVKSFTRLPSTSIEISLLA